VDQETLNTSKDDQDADKLQRSFSRISENQGKGGLEVIAERKEDDRDEGNLGSAEKYRSAQSSKEPVMSGKKPPSLDADLIASKNDSAMKLEPGTPALSGGGSDIDLDGKDIANMSMRDKICQIFTDMHQSMTRLAEQYEAERKRVVYITPTLFTQLFPLFEKVLARKNETIELERSKYEQGVKKLDEAKVMIVEMDAALMTLEPQLVAK
jgi:hypothetical protein